RTARLLERPQAGRRLRRGARPAPLGPLRPPGRDRLAAARLRHRRALARPRREADAGPIVDPRRPLPRPRARGPLRGGPRRRPPRARPPAVVPARGPGDGPSPPVARPRPGGADL